MEIEQAQQIMGSNFLGPGELQKIREKMHILNPFGQREIPRIPFSKEVLERRREDSVLILGIPETEKEERLTINAMRKMFGWNPEDAEPCFYNQDWYLNEPFANEHTLEYRWYLLGKSLKEETRGKEPNGILEMLKKEESFPSAILTVFAFFAYYFHTNGKELLWEYDFVWCCDVDSNGDRIYTGRYSDPKRVNKHGFNIHRYLSLHPGYGAISQLK